LKVKEEEVQPYVEVHPSSFLSTPFESSRHTLKV